MIWQRKIPHELFTFRDLFTEKVRDIHMPYMNAYYQAILALLNEEIPHFVQDKPRIQHLKEFFGTEIDNFEMKERKWSWPKMQNLAYFKKS